MNFTDLNINKPILNALEDLGLNTPTQIQEKVFSVVMSGRDVSGIAQTGTGKTLAYLLPLMRMWAFSKDKLPQILVLVPTRELVIQVVNVAKDLGKYMSFDAVGVYGGVNMKTHVTELANGCDLVVATPGRFIDLAAVGALKVKNIKKVVVDEFDMMLDLGFRPQLKLIFDKIPEKRQNLLFSATKSEEVKDLIEDFFYNPIEIKADNAEKPLENITQKAYHLPNFYTKINFLEILLGNDLEMQKNIIFVSDKGMADLLFEQLTARGLENMDVIHSNKSQNYRFNAVSKFDSGETKTLIATDIVSRGIDVSEVSHVINFELPEEPEVYVHRIGRTGRANNSGIAISLISNRENDRKTAIEELLNQSFEFFETPKSLEISDVFLPAETEEVDMKIIEPKNTKPAGAFHEKKEKNQKVNVRRDIQAEKKRKYGKSYRKNM